MECAYGAPLTFSEANVLSRMPINDTKPKVSAPRKQREKERGRYKNDPQIPPSSKKNEKKGRYDSDANAAAASSSSHSNQGRPNSHTVFSDLPDTPASPELPPVVSRALTEDQATPKGFIVPVVDGRKMPDKDNFAAGITPFQYDNLAKRTNRMDIMEELLKSIKKD
uniref:Uncharacterized protein n=1 Tax=Panagrolaimus superbus TaxID=310955 RepID=A0A914YE47_9BILA